MHVRYHWRVGDSVVAHVAGHMDLLLSSPASRCQGLELMLKSEKGEHLQMDFLQLHKVLESLHFRMTISMLGVFMCASV